jgi:hypothetical protein
MIERLCENGILLPSVSDTRPAARRAPQPFRTNNRSVFVAERNTQMSKIVHNEKLKLRATFLNILGIAAFISCFLTPGFFAFAETRIERAMAFHAFASSRLDGLRE